MDNEHQSVNRKLRIFQQSKEKSECLLAEGMRFASEECWKQYPPAESLTEVLVTGARYLHRGYYCPSPVRHKIISNSRRGRILCRPTSRSKISHYYYFGPTGKLLIAKSVLPNGSMKTEYLVYLENKILGFAFDEWNTLVGLSEELYKDGRIINYFCASCFEHEADNLHMGITEMNWEEYRYLGEDGLEAGVYFITFPMIEITETDIDTLLHGGQYRFIGD